MSIALYSLAWSNEGGGVVAMMLREECLLLPPSVAIHLAFELCRVLETPDAAAAMAAGELGSRSDLLSRVQAIGTPIRQALLDGRTDNDGDEPLPDISRELVALTMRRLLALCGDIEAGLFAPEPEIEFNGFNCEEAASGESTN